MVPIEEKGKSSGIGYNYKPFLDRFIEICKNHLENKRSKSFAFIFYDFHNKEIRNILNSKSAFTHLDRLSGKELSVFYIDSKDKSIVEEFNYIFLGAFEIQKELTLPSVVFFKFDKDDVQDIQIVELTQAKKMFAFKELYSSIESYLKSSKEIVTPKRNILPELAEKAMKISIEKLIEILVDKVIENTY